MYDYDDTKNFNIAHPYCRAQVKPMVKIAEVVVPLAYAFVFCWGKIFVTRHEKTGLMYTQNLTTFLDFKVS